MQNILKPSVNIRFPNRFPGPGAQLPSDQLISALSWRYAVKQFNPSRRITSATWATLEESLRLSPSSLGLQPWKFVVVTDAQVKEKLVEHSYGQRQIADCSHLLVIAAKSDYTPEDTEQFISRNAQVRGVEASSLSGFASMINGSVTSKTPEERLDWLRRQCYIPLGVFLTAAAFLRVDVCPMEGFVAHGYDKILGLEGTGYSATVIAPAGYRAEDDKYAHLPKVRFAPEDVFLHI